MQTCLTAQLIEEVLVHTVFILEIPWYLGILPNKMLYQEVVLKMNTFLGTEFQRR